MAKKLAEELFVSATTIAAMRFTIRDLLWLTVTVALAAAWWSERAKLEQRLRTPREVWEQRADAAANLLQSEGWTTRWLDDEAEFTKKEGAKQVGFRRSTPRLLR